MTKVVGKAKGTIRFKLIRWHRLSIFEKTFDKYIRGKVPAAYLSARANRMKELGLPVKPKGKGKA